MQMSEKTKRIILFILGSIVIILIILLVMKNFSTKEYVVTFDTNGGGNVSTLTIEKNGKVTKPADPVKEGYVFDGWYYNNKKFDFNTEITQDMKLEARWIPVEATGISLNAQSLTLKPDGTAELKVIFTPDGASSELTWKSSDEKIVTVSEDGKLKALKEGGATITVTTTNGKYKAECKVSVKKDAVAVTSVSISGDKEVTVGNTIKLTANIKPKDASNKDVVWKSNDKKIATVDSKGNVKGVKAGKVKITVTTVDGEKEAKIEITVKDKSTSNPSTEPTDTSKPSTGGNNTPSKDEPTGGNTQTEENPKLTKVTISGPTTVEEGKTISLIFSVIDKNYKYDSATWEINNISGEATIDKGQVTGVKEGKVEVILTIDDISTTYEITVTAKNVEYVITFTRLLKYDDTWDQYELKGVTADGDTFIDFNYFTYNSDDFGTKQIKRTLNKSKVNENITTATMHLTNGKTVTAKVIYDSRKID